MPRRPSSRSRGPTVSALLRSPAGEARGELRWLSPSRCSIELSGESPWRPGDRLMVELRNVLLDEPLRTLATCAPDEGDGLLQLEFGEPEVVAEALPHALVSAFDRRRAPRVHVADVVTVRRIETAPRLRSLALLIDVSVHGLGLRLPPTISRGLELGEALELGFALPELEDEFTLTGHVKSLWPSEGYVGCGVELDRTTEVFEAQRERLQEAVAERRARLNARHRAS